MGVKKVKKFQILGLKKQVDLITKAIIKNKQIELLKKEKYEQEFKEYKTENPYKDYFSQISDIFSKLKLESNQAELDLIETTKLDLNQLDNFINPIQNKLDKLARISKKIDQEEKRLQNLKKHIYLMRNMDVQLEDLKNLSYITLIFGSLTKERYSRLIENVTNLPILVLEVNSNEERVWFFTFAKKEYEEKAIDILKSANFERIELPDRVTEQPRSILKQADHRLEKIKIIREQIKLEYDKLKHRYQVEIKNYYQKLLFLNKIKEIDNHYYDESNYFFMVSGWISEENEVEFKQKIADKYPEVIYTSQKINDIDAENPPTIIENPGWVKGFSALVKLYGLPKYGELDPSLFFAVTYILLFGIMFGDLGQGFIFALLGYLIINQKISFIKEKSIGQVLMLLGGSSMLFGIFYGSVFSLESIIPALVIKPMDNIMSWLGFTILIGIVLLIIAMFFNLFNSFKNKDYQQAFFAESGLSGLIFYLFILASLAVYAIKGSLLLPLSLTILISVILLAIIFLKEPLGNLVETGSFKIEQSLGNFLLESGFEIFDIVLNYFSNTLSFLRVGAFTLNHFGLSMAVILLINMVSNHAGSLFILVLGNLIIMVLEGVVVGIQILRLEFFEIFSKFYSGTGREFNPIKLN
ncbi:V-type ATP synthase subunit I [Halanaerobium salsuginis]|uniref:V/A-type H+-transporting ATPase subunit I n=1 Tax=Halanaerobium salsuginis TaxID=29563 RepID=A0A1I4GH44_9FIRM|nr:V-type ATPase 116kDa subunit family protein [Halanaerobium salsuginis]SFL28840.1 V/A-type H+-transporting ATPase subunit I [Halanaerobium salsuginis]